MTTDDGTASKNITQRGGQQSHPASGIPPFSTKPVPEPASTDDVVPATFTRPQRDALAWVYAQMTRRRRALWRQPSLNTLKRLRDWGLIEFHHHRAHRMTLIDHALLTETGRLAYAREWPDDH